MNMPSTPGYGDAPLGVECALPDEAPRLAQPGDLRPSIWRRMIYRIKYGAKAAPAQQTYRAV